MSASLANRDLFLLHQRNPRAIEAIADDERHRAANEDLEDRFRRFLASPAIPLSDRVRMACSIGAVFAALMGATEVFGEVDTDEVAGYAARPSTTSSRPAADPPFSRGRVRRVRLNPRVRASMTRALPWTVPHPYLRAPIPSSRASSTCSRSTSTRARSRLPGHTSTTRRR
jgi:hypothetical protein